MSFIDVNQVYKSYPHATTWALEEVSLTVAEGEIFSLLGPNGAGKTTLISIISTLFPPTRGQVRVAGLDVQREPRAVRELIGVVPQELALYGELTAEENLRFWGEMRGLSGKGLKREIQEKLELMGLSERARERVATFSGGMKRRLNLAVGLLGNPPLIILDEPTVAIDPQSRRYILDYVKHLNAQGTTVLYTTHYMEEAQELSQRLAILDHGRIIALGTLAELVRQVGEGETLLLELAQAEGTRQLAEAVQTALGLPAHASDGRVLLNAPSATAVLPQVLAQAGALQLNVRHIEIREPNLETLFLALTGRALRD